jgi:hypothetical protein
MLKILFTFVTNYATLIKRSTILSLPLQLVFPNFTLTVSDNIYIKKSYKFKRKTQTKELCIIEYLNEDFTSALIIEAKLNKLSF